MNRTAFLASLSLSIASVAEAQSVADAISRAPAFLRPGLESETRAVRRDVPLTKAYRRALAAGTRDFSGRPGPNYWQLETDFTIHARLERETQSIVGRETIVVHNHSPDELTELALRLDHNHVPPTGAARDSSVPAETTEGMVVTRIADRWHRRSTWLRAGGKGGRGGPTSVYGLDQHRRADAVVGEAHRAAGGKRRSSRSIGTRGCPAATRVVATA